MTFVKYLKIKSKKKAQAALEYFIVFAVIATVAWWGFSSPLLRIRAILQGRFYQKATGVEGLNLENE